MATVSQLRAQRKLRRYMDALRRELPTLRTKLHVQYLGLFGSYVQGTPRKDSDLDVLVEIAEEPSLFEFIELEDHLSSLLGIKVDLVMKGYAQTPDRAAYSERGRGPVTRKREFLDYLADIQDAARNISQFVVGMTWTQFAWDKEQ